MKTSLKINLPDKEEAGIEKDRQFVRSGNLTKKMPRIVFGYAATRLASNMNRVTAAMRNLKGNGDQLLFEYFGIQKPTDDDKSPEKATRLGLWRGGNFLKAADKEGLYLCAAMCGACAVKDCMYFEHQPQKLWEQLKEHDFGKKIGAAEEERAEKNGLSADRRNALWNYFRAVIRGEESDSRKPCAEIYFGGELPEPETESLATTEESFATDEEFLLPTGHEEGDNDAAKIMCLNIMDQAVRDYRSLDYQIGRHADWLQAEVKFKGAKIGIDIDEAIETRAKSDIKAEKFGKLACKYCSNRKSCGLARKAKNGKSNLYNKMKSTSLRKRSVVMSKIRNGATCSDAFK